MRRTILIGLLLSALALPALAVSTVKVKTPSSITIKTKGTKFHGRVKSPKAACVQGRTVKLLHVLTGKDQVLAKRTTSANGKWHATVSGFAGISMARFQAKVKGRSEGTAGTIQVCEGARSKVVMLGG